MKSTKDISFAEERRKMVQEQQAKQGIHDKLILEAMNKVPREKFVPDSQKKYAYIDSALTIGEHQTISQPYIVALMLQAAKLKPILTLLEIGTGSGYGSAVASQLVSKVYTIERLPNLGKKAINVLNELKIENVKVYIQNGVLGLAEEAPFDVIIVTAAAKKIPEKLKKQLSQKNGVLIIPLALDSFNQQLMRVTRLNYTEYKEEFLANVQFVPLVDKS